jgi:hypothetical protein
MQAFVKQLELLTRVMKDLKDEMILMRQQNGGVRHRADRRKFNMSEGEKLRLQVSNIYDHNASMMLDKKRGVE